MRKNKWSIWLSVVLLLAFFGGAVAWLRGEVVPPAHAEPSSLAAEAVGPSVEASPVSRLAALGGAAASADLDQPESQAAVPSEPAATAVLTATPWPTRAATRTPSPTATPAPTRTPSPTPLPTLAAPTGSPAGATPAATGASATADAGASAAADAGAAAAADAGAAAAADAGAAATADAGATAAPPTPTRDFSVAPTPVPTLAAAASKDVVHFLLVGLDHSNRAKVELTDVMIVGVVNKKTAQVSLLSIPRDLWVYIPTYGYSRINMAHKVGYLNDYPGGGPALLAETIRLNLGIPIDHWARIDFDGFATAVDELGGVDLIVHCPVDLQYRSTDRGESRILEPGEYHLDGETALRYVRTRRDGTDFDRARRQQQFLKAVWDQVRAPGLLGKVPGLWSALKNTFETDLNLGDVLGLAPLALEVKPENVRSRYIAYKHTVDWTTDKGWRVLLPKPDEIAKLVDSLYASPAAVQAGEPSARVVVENGTWRDQMALVAADRLRWEGFVVVKSGLAEERGQASTRLVVYRDRPADVDKLVSLLGLKRKNVSYQLDDSAEADILVVLGADYNPCR